MPNPSTLTIVRPGGLGDSLLLAPALESIRSGAPASSVCLIGYPDRLAPLLEAGLADEVRHLDSWITREKTNESNLPEGRIVSFLPLPFSQYGETAIEIYSAFPEDSPAEHVAAYLARRLTGKELTGVATSPLQVLVQRSENGLLPTVWMHPGAGNKEKRWPLQNFLRLAREIVQYTGARVRFLLGEAEGDLRASLTAAGEQVVCIEKPVEVARLWKKGDGFIGNDSGMAHLAGLCGLQTLVLFGPTDPVLWHPCGEHVRVLKGKSSGSMPEYDEVRRTLTDSFQAGKVAESL